MVRSKKNNQNNSKGTDEPKDLIELLKNFYQPESDEMQEFSEFYSSIEKKLDAQNPVTKVAQANNDLEEKYKKRQQKFERFIDQLEDNLNATRRQLAKRVENRKKILTLSVTVLALFALVFAYVYLQANLIDIKNDNQEIILKIKTPRIEPVQNNLS